MENFAVGYAYDKTLQQYHFSEDSTLYQNLYQEIYFPISNKT